MQNTETEQRARCPVNSGTAGIWRAPMRTPNPQPGRKSLRDPTSFTQSSSHPSADDSEDNMLILAQHPADSLLPLGLRTGQGARRTRACGRHADSCAVTGARQHARPSHSKGKARWSCLASLSSTPPGSHAASGGGVSRLGAGGRESAAGRAARTKLTALGSGPSAPPRSGAFARSAGAPCTRRAARRRRFPARAGIVAARRTHTRPSARTFHQRLESARTCTPSHPKRPRPNLPLRPGRGQHTGR